MKCGAKLRCKDAFCKKAPMSNGSGRCRNHGGASLRGKSSGRYKHGLYTKEKIALGKFVREQLNELEYLAILCGLIGLPK